MNHKVDYHALLLYEPAAYASPTPVVRRYIVPQAFVDGYSVRQDQPPVQWSAKPGATSMALDWYDVPEVEIVATLPVFTIPYTGAPREFNGPLTFTIYNDGGADVTVEYDLPGGDISALASPDSWNPDGLTATATSGSVVVPAFDSVEVHWPIRYFKPSDESGYIFGVEAPEGCFIVGGLPYPAVETAIGSINFPPIF